MKTPSTTRSTRHVPLVLLAFACACSDGPVSPRVAPGPAAGRVLAEFECTVELVAGLEDCRLVGPSGSDGGARFDVSLGSGPITMQGSFVHSRGSSADEDTSTATVSFISKATQPLGTTDGTTPAASGNRLYYTTPPYVKAVSSGTVAGASVRVDNADGIADFSASNMPNTWDDRPYFQYNGIVVHNAASSSKQIRYVYSSNVTSFSYGYRIMAPVQFEHGWITISPSSTPVMGPGDVTTLTGASFDYVGASIPGDPITWSSSNTAVATVNASTGEVTAVAEGTATITATATNNAQRTGSRPITVDAAPAVVSATPEDGDTDVAANTSIVVTFSEAVDVTTSSFTLECPSGSAQPFAVTGSGTSTITLNPDSDLPAVTTCTVTGIGNQVSDADANDGPNLLAGNHSFSFEVAIKAIADTFSPTVVGNTTVNTANTSPAFSVTDNDQIKAGTTISFVGWNGGAGRTEKGGTVSITTWGTGMGQFIYDPPAGYEGADSFEYTVQSGSATSTAKVTLLVQGATPADAAPTVLSTTPEDGAAPVASNANVEITFSEPVIISVNSFLLECPVSYESLTFTVSGSGTRTITLDPDADLPEQTICTVTVAASVVRDADTNDGPDVMELDYVFSFEVGSTGNP